MYELRGQWDKAISAFDRLIIIEPKMSTWRLARARALFHVGEYAKAIADFRTVEVTSARLSLNDYTLLCEAGFRVGNTEAVHRALAMIEEINPEPHPRSELIRGLMAFRTGQGAEARKILLRAAAIWPQNEALTKALRRTSAVYYRHKRQLRATNFAHVSDGSARPMSAAKAASLQLVQEYTPPVPDPPAVIWAEPAKQSRSTTQTTPANKPPRLSAVFADVQSRPQGLLAGQWHQKQPNANKVIPAGYTTPRQASIGFRQTSRSDG